MKDLLSHAHHIVIFTHMAPDGDAMGSSLAMYHWLNDQINDQMVNDQMVNVQVIIPNAFPSFFNWMPGVETMMIYENDPEACNAIIDGADLFICTDFNDPKRIGPMGERMLNNPCPKILIDHHLNPVDFATEVHSFPDASSTCEIVYKLLFGKEHINEPKVPNECAESARLTVAIATCLYTGLMTDTGNFSFNSTRCELYEIIAELVRAGVKKDEIYNAVFNQYSADRVRLTGYALYKKLRLYPDYHLALITLSADELERYNYKVGDTEGLVNMPLQISDVYYSVFVREERPKPGTSKPRIRLSFRSQGNRPVNIWAHEVFNGGGHANASGGELFGSLSSAIRLFEQSFPKYLKKE